MKDLIEDLEWNKVNDFKWRNLYEVGFFFKS
jgi:elongin-A